MTLFLTLILLNILFFISHRKYTNLLDWIVSFAKEMMEDTERDELGIYSDDLKESFREMYKTQKRRVENEFKPRSGLNSFLWLLANLVVVALFFVF